MPLWMGVTLEALLVGGLLGGIVLFYYLIKRWLELAGRLVRAIERIDNNMERGHREGPFYR